VEVAQDAAADEVTRKAWSSMKFLRTVSTRRLLALIAGVVVVVAGGTAIAVAAAGNGPVPRPKPLAEAVRSALAAPAVPGISARIQFTNHLIDASSIQGADPLLSGATGRLWLSADHRLRLELQSDSGDAQVVVNNGSFWVYDPSSNTVYEGTVPAGTTPASKPAGTHDQLPSLAQIRSEIANLAAHANLSGARPSDVAGRAAYTVTVSPKHDGGLLGAGALAWDALNGVPLRFAVYARGDSSPVLELKATDVSFGAVSPSVFNISPPPNAKVVKVDTSASTSRADSVRPGARHVHQKDVSGPAAVAKRLSFPLVAPGKLVGLPRRSVTLLSWGGKPAALVSYGQNLGGIAVIEQPADPAASSQGSTQDHGGLSLPSVSINGATGQELDTALGTVVRFTRGGVAYTVLGSVPPAAADAAARAL
jgi:outer membrane lipoprotein-sorting protein